MEKHLFEYKHYKDYLLSRTGSKKQRRGIKTAMAQALRCQPTYVSQVLNGSADFSLEQAEILSRFLDHTKEERQFFMLLVQKDRAATKPLKVFFQEQIDLILAKRMVLVERLGSQTTLSKENQAFYYSTWHYAAIHIALTIAPLRTRSELAKFLQLPLKKVSEILEFLVSVGLARQEGETFAVGTSQIRLDNDSHNIIKHHMNWRQQAMDSLDREDLKDLHYSAVVSLSSQDAVKIKDKILDALKEHLAIIKESKEEELYCYCIDFFSMKKTY